jgi:phosphoribosylaminoimidazolecarboxamide formyltransferase/IMP cyclohydrolase
VNDDLVEAYKLAYLADVNAAMGGIIAVNRPVTPALAEAIVESYKRWGKAAGAGGFFAEIVIAPAFDPRALEIIRNREGWGSEVRLIETGDLTGKRNGEKYTKYVTGGLIVQDRDLLTCNEDVWQVVTKKQPTPQQMDDLRFAWVVCKHVKSNAIVLAKGQTLLAAGAGQMARVNSARLATMLARQYGGGNVIDPAGCVLASDAFFPFPDSLDWAVEIGATAVIEPGGGKKDADVIARADDLGLAMVFTKTRHFNH